MMFFADLDRDALLVPPPERPTLREVPLKPANEISVVEEQQRRVHVALRGVDARVPTSAVRREPV
jgi:hypothetical protein